MTWDINSEKRRYCKTVRIDSSTYKSDYRIDKRIRAVFGTFARTLHGRSEISSWQKHLEVMGLVSVVKENVIYPILESHKEIFKTNDTFDVWHEYNVDLLKAKCPISWNNGNRLTVGMCQKIINLHCKDFWALDLIQNDYSQFFHPVIDQATLIILGLKGKIIWTKLDSYDQYKQLQMKLREISLKNKIHPLALECANWNENRAGLRTLLHLH